MIRLVVCLSDEFVAYFYSFNCIQFTDGHYFSYLDTNYGKPKGILELGGASTQIAFIPEGNILDNKYPATIAGVAYNLYSHSYLIYGQDEVDEWIRRKVHSASPASTEDHQTLDDPCLLNGKTLDLLLLRSTSHTYFSKWWWGQSKSSVLIYRMTHHVASKTVTIFNITAISIELSKNRTK